MTCFWDLCCRIKYYNNSLFHNVQRDFIAQTGDPTGTGKGGDSIYGCVDLSVQAAGSMAGTLCSRQLQPAAVPANSCDCSTLSYCSAGTPITHDMQQLLRRRSYALMLNRQPARQPPAAAAWVACMQQQSSANSTAL